MTPKDIFIVFFALPMLFAFLCMVGANKIEKPILRKLMRGFAICFLLLEFSFLVSAFAGWPLVVNWHHNKWLLKEGHLTYFPQGIWKIQTWQAYTSGQQVFRRQFRSTSAISVKLHINDEHPIARVSVVSVVDELAFAKVVGEDVLWRPSFIHSVVADSFYRNKKPSQTNAFFHVLDEAAFKADLQSKGITLIEWLK